jgi:tubby-related protein 1
MQELQDRKRAERTGAADLATPGAQMRGGDVLSNSTGPGVGVPLMATTNAGGLNMQPDAPVSQTELNLQSQGMDMVFDPTAGSSKPRNSSSEDKASSGSAKPAEENQADQLAVVDTSTKELCKEFIQRPFTQSGVVQCQITRHKSFMFNSFPTYECYLKDGMRFVMAARKRKKTKGAYYIISTSNSDISRHDDNFVGKVRSNVLGTNFSFFDSGIGADDLEKGDVSGSGDIRKEIGFLTYESNVLGAKGPRKMTCSLPKLGPDGTPAIFTGGSTGNDSMEATMSEHAPNGRIDETIQLHNRAPKWSERVAAYTLDFKGRVTMASVKNFQLVADDDDDNVLLQFGKVGVDDFTMDFRAPLSPIQAFAICLSSLDNKWACE